MLSLFNELFGSSAFHWLLKETKTFTLCFLEPVYNHLGEIVNLKFLLSNSYFQETFHVETPLKGKIWEEVFHYPNSSLHIHKRVLQKTHYETYIFFDQNEGINVKIHTFRVTDNILALLGTRPEIEQKFKYSDSIYQLLQSVDTDQLFYYNHQIEDLGSSLIHELKSSLRTIELCSKFIQEDFYHELNPDIMELLLNISQISRKALKYMEIWQDNFMILKSPIQKRSLNLDHLVDAAYNRIKLLYGIPQIKLIKQHKLPEIMGDLILLEQVLYNLFSNSVKFAKDRQNIQINVSTQVTKIEVIISIQDNGIGIDEIYPDKVFEAFIQLHNNQEYEGSGMGLYTVKTIIQKHGGSVSIEGVPGEGTTVTIKLPR